LFEYASVIGELSDAEVQALIGALDKPVDPQGLAGSYAYIKSHVDWDETLAGLVDQGLLAHQEKGYILTGQGRERAVQLSHVHPPMWFWYDAFYKATRTSMAYATLCERTFARNLTQHGFADMVQLGKLLEVTALGAQNRVLDLGCGSGAMAEYISDVTGAHVTGVDYIPEAIRQARERTADKRHRLAFRVGYLGALDLPLHGYDTLISIDTLYFTDDLEGTIERLRALLVPGGQMGIFYSHGVSPGTPIETFSRDTLPADNTPLARALRANALQFRAWDYTAADYRHAQLKEQVTEELRAEFEAEGNLFLYRNRHGEAQGVKKGVAFPVIGWQGPNANTIDPYAGGSVGSKPLRRAMDTASAREPAPSLLNMLVTCALTVRSEILSCRATSLLVAPWASRANTCPSRFERVSNSAG
jgi:SAM-dependent methyltransferase